MVYLQSTNASDPDQIGSRLDEVSRTMTYNKRGLVNLLEDVLSSTRYLRCSDPRDKVYAVLNLDWKASSHIQSNYSKSASEVFRSVVEYSLSKDQSLRLLANCSIRETGLSMPTWVPDWSVQSQVDETGMINSDRTGFMTKAHVSRISGNILMAKGIHLTTVHEITKDLPQEVPGAANELADFTRQLVSAIDDSGPEMTTQSRIESLCRTLCCDRFAERWHPPKEQYPSFPELIKHVMNNFEWHHDNLNQPSEVYQLYARYANKMMTGRTLVTMANGLLGLVPEDTRPGDIIYVLFGCDVPLVLRPDEGSTFKIVGECYVDGVMNGEPFLGELPNNWSRVSRILPNAGRTCFGFIDGSTGRIQKDDPRLSEPLPMGWRIKSHDREASVNWYVNDLTGEDAGIRDPRLEPTALMKQRGLDIREFRLI